MNITSEMNKIITLMLNIQELFGLHLLRWEATIQNVKKIIFCFQ